MQFVNIIVHSVENMNFRVHLQYEFTQLRLDEYLEKLRLFESDELQVYFHNFLYKKNINNSVCICFLNSKLIIFYLFEGSNICVFR